MRSFGEMPFRMFNNNVHILIISIIVLIICIRMAGPPS